MVFDYETFEILKNPETKSIYPVYFYGNRFLDSLSMHRSFSNLDAASGADNAFPSYHMRFPP